MLNTSLTFLFMKVEVTAVLYLWQLTDRLECHCECICVCVACMCHSCTEQDPNLLSLIQVMSIRDTYCILDVCELLGYLLKSLQNLLPLAEVPEEQMQGSGHQRRIVMHG